MMTNLVVDSYFSSEATVFFVCGGIDVVGVFYFFSSRGGFNLRLS